MLMAQKGSSARTIWTEGHAPLNKNHNKKVLNTLFPPGVSVSVAVRYYNKLTEVLVLTIYHIGNI